MIRVPVMVTEHVQYADHMVLQYLFFALSAAVEQVINTTLAYYNIDMVIWCHQIVAHTHTHIQRERDIC